MTIKKIHNEGAIFIADNDELEALFGHALCASCVYGSTIEVVKEGWNDSHEGWKIMVWKVSEGGQGQRTDGHYSAGDWSVGDKMMSKTCIEGDYPMSSLVKLFKY